MRSAMSKYRYGSGQILPPTIPGRRDTPHMERIYLPHLLPLEADQSLEGAVNLWWKRQSGLYPGSAGERRPEGEDRAVAS